MSSMVALTNKTSSQSFFLRVLKVIIQLREAALLAIKNNKTKKDTETDAAAVAAVTIEEADGADVASPAEETTTDSTPMDVESPTNTNSQEVEESSWSSETPRLLQVARKD